METPLYFEDFKVGREWRTEGRTVTEADIVIVPEIYFVRDSEQERHAVTAGHLVDRLRKQGVTAMHLHPFEAIVEQLELITQPGDLVVTMGAGDVWKIGRAYLTPDQQA